MKCPNCKNDELRPVFTKQGVEVDYCDSCKGIWLDKGELYHFIKKPKLVSQKLKEALKNVTPTKKLSPRTGKPMQEIVYPGGPAFDVCPRSGGLWFDAGELKELLIRERNIRMTYDRKTLKKRPRERTTDHLKEPSQDRKDNRRGPGLMPLPNLFFRSTISLFGLYAILGAALIAAVEFTALDTGVAVAIGVFIIILQFLIGPFLMDISLRWLYKMDWVTPAELPRHFRQFVYNVCKNNGMKFPRFGIINDGAPQAFTYGHTPNNDRIVISRGILELLEPREAEAVVAHELGHAVHWDMFLMTVAQLVPLILYFLYRTLIRMRSSGRDKSAGPRIAIAIGAYILYIITEYLVLWFSRTREYYADGFAGETTGNPSGLASALVKIAYGLAGQEKKKNQKNRQAEAPTSRLSAPWVSLTAGRHVHLRSRAIRKKLPTPAK